MPRPTEDEKREELASKRDDVLVHPGDMTKADLDQIVLDDDYEAMVEDYVGNFNHMIVQGQPAIRALFAFAQAFAIVLGSCIVCGLRVSVTGRIIAQITQNAAQAAGKLKQIHPN